MRTAPRTMRSVVFSDNGKFRGQLLSGWLKYRCCPQLQAHAVVEYFQPGSYYSKENRDHAVFMRIGMEYVF